MNNVILLAIMRAESDTHHYGFLWPSLFQLAVSDEIMKQK